MRFVRANLSVRTQSPSCILLLSIAFLVGCDADRAIAPVTKAISIDDPRINAKREACFRMDNLENRYDFSGNKAYVVQLDSSDTSSADRIKRAGKLRGAYIAKRPSEADAFLFWDYRTGKVGYYSETGASAYYANLAICVIDQASDSSSRFTISASPPRSIAVRGPGDVTMRNTVHEFASNWLGAKFAGRSPPAPTGTLRVSIWEPCPPLEVMRDDNLQYPQPLTEEELMLKCYNDLQGGWRR